MVLHITDHLSWREALRAGTFRSADSETDGFIHCSALNQVARVANDRFAGREDLLLIVIDTEAISSAVVWEDCHESGEEFPHILGSLPVAEVDRIIQFKPGRDGEFENPKL